MKLPNDKMFPNRSEEEQDMELEPVVFGPPAYGSPDPETANQTLLPLVENPMVTAENQENAAAAQAEPNDRKAGQWKAMIEGTASQDELDALRAEYDDSDADFSTVEDAFEKKEAELADADNGS